MVYKKYCFLGNTGLSSVRSSAHVFMRRVLPQDSEMFWNGDF